MRFSFFLPTIDDKVKPQIKAIFFLQLVVHFFLHLSAFFLRWIFLGTQSHFYPPIFLLDVPVIGGGMQWFICHFPPWHLEVPGRDKGDLAEVGDHPFCGDHSEMGGHQCGGNDKQQTVLPRKLDFRRSSQSGGFHWPQRSTIPSGFHSWWIFLLAKTSHGYYFFWLLRDHGLYPNWSSSDLFLTQNFPLLCFKVFWRNYLTKFPHDVPQMTPWPMFCLFFKEDWDILIC